MFFIGALASMVLALNAQEVNDASAAVAAQEPADSINRLDTIQVDPIEAKSHFLLNFGGGMHTMLYDLNNGKSQVGGGALAQLMYQYMITDNWGIGFGVGFSSMRARAMFDDFHFDQEATHAEALGDYKNYLAHTRVAGVKEIQDMISVDVPIQIFYRHPFNDLWALNMGLGVTVNFPVWAQYQLKSGKYTLTGDFNNVHIEDMPNHGFSTYDLDIENKGKFEYNQLNVGIQFDLGATYRIAALTDLYFGAYLDYECMASVKSSSDKYIFDASKMAYQSVLETNEIKDRAGYKINPLEVGVKLGFRFGMHDRKAEMDAKKAKLAEYEEAERIAREKAEAERLAREAAERAEAERLAREAAERERLAREAAERERLAREEAERNRKKIEIVLQGVHFNHKSIEPIFNANATEVLGDLKKYMDENPSKRIVLTGHTDSTGTPENNMVWGQKRADAYKTALVKKGFNPDQIITVSKGQNEPIASNDTEEGRAKNRRVEMEMVNK